MKKFLAILLAAMMLLATAGMALAGNEDELVPTPPTPNIPTTYTITVANPDAGHTYEAYQIFTGDLAGNVLSNITLGTGVTDAILTLKGTTYADAAALAEALTSDNVEEFIAVVAANLTEVKKSSDWDGTNTQYTISGLEPGYYFVKDKDGSVLPNDVYTKFMVKIVKDVIATPKTDKTGHEKKVYENVKRADNPKTGAAGINYNDVADYCIGDTVPFALYSKVPDLTHFDHYKMIFHDIMSVGLTFDPKSVRVFVAGNELESAEFSVIDSCGDGCTFEVKIHELVGKEYAKGAEIRVDFNATLNSDAVIGLDGNPNQSKLEFSNNPNDTTATTETPWDYVVVFTYELDLTKVNGANHNEKLPNAEFVLQNKEGAYVQVDTEGKVTGWTNTLTEASTLVSDANGLFKVIGLDDGVYTLTETKAPEGYNQLRDSITIEIKATTANNQLYANVPANALTALQIKVDNGTYANGNVTAGNVEATIENNQGATLPETGGIGTTLFYLFGGIMAAGSALILVVRRRAGAEEE